jgi:hypothetical protein
MAAILIRRWRLVLAVVIIIVDLWILWETSGL